MDRVWMLRVLKERIKELERLYRLYVNNTDASGRQLSVSYATVQRSRVKRDLNLCELVLLLLERSDVMFLDHAKAIDGFQKLVTPTDRSRVKV